MLDGSFTEAIVKCFTTSKANAFENLLEPLQKLLRLSPPVALSLARPDLFSRILQKLRHTKAVVRLNLLRIVRSICDSSEQQGGLIRRYGLFEAIEKLAETDSAVLVRNMAGELVRSSLEREKQSMNGSRRRPGRRASSSATPPSLLTSQSMPPTPQYSRSTHSSGSFSATDRSQLNGVHGAVPFRPASRDSAVGAASGGTSSAAKSRLPRTAATRLPRQSMAASPRRVENVTPTPTSSTSSSSLLSPRRSRQTNGEQRWS